MFDPAISDMFTDYVLHGVVPTPCSNADGPRVITHAALVTGLD